MPFIPLPTYNEPDETVPPVIDSDESRNAWIRWYLDTPNWKCDACGSVMFGRVKYCIYCKWKYKNHVSRPITYIENTFGG